MRYVAKLLGLVAVTAVMVPLTEIPGFSKEPRDLMPAALTQSAEARKAEADRLLQQGIQQFNVSQFREALRSWEQALAIYRELGVREAFPQESRRGEGRALGNLGVAYASLGDYRQAIDFHEQALAIFRELGDRGGEGNALNGLGNAHLNMGDYHQAIEFHGQYLAISREMGDRGGEGGALGNLGAAYDSLGDYRQAIEFHEQSLVIAREMGDRGGEGRGLGNLGNAYDSLGDYRQAIEFHEQSLAIFRQIGNRSWEGGALGNLGNAYDSLGDHRRAIELNEQNLVITRELGDRSGEGRALSSLGAAYRNLGDYRRAIEFHEQSLEITREIGDRHGEGLALGNLGSAYRSLGDYRQAIEFHEQDLVIAREIGNRGGEGRALSGLGKAYLSLGDYRRAIEFHEQGLAIARELGNRDGEGNVLSSLGNVSYSLGDYRRAVEFYEQDLVIAREVGNRRGEGTALGNLGIAYNSLGDYRLAITFSEQGLAIAQEIGDRNAEGIVLGNLGAVYLGQEQFSLAETVLYQALDVQDTLRDSDLPDADKISLFETQRANFLLLQRALVAQEKVGPALEVAERGRGRAFAELLSQRLSTDEAAINPAPPNLDAIQALAQQQQTTLVQYSLILAADDDYAALYIWVVSPTGNITFRRQPLDGVDLASLVTIARQSLGVRGDRLATAIVELTPEALARQQAETEANLRQLYDVLIAPIADLLPTDPTQPVVFMPQDELFLVPFAALKAPSGSYLIENHTILTAPSIQVFGLANEAAAATAGANGHSPFSANNALIVGNPTMPTVTFLSEGGSFQDVRLDPLDGAQQEAEAISSFLQTPALIGGAATEAAVKQRMAAASVIHLATHGLLEYGDPRQTGTRDLPGAIALTPDSTEDGLLTSAEILEMDLQAELAVLSACDTGRGRITGDGVVGLSRSLITAGVPSVVVSLWAVPDAPTAELMTEFYRQLDQGQDKAQALRQAMLTTLEHHPEPRAWAAFTLIGAAN